MRIPTWKKIGRFFLWTLVGLTVLIVAIPFLLYVPFIQDTARKFAIEKVKESTGMTIDLDYLRLKFPLRLQLDGLDVIEASGDTMITASQASVDVALLPLFHKKIEVRSVSLKDAFYRLGTPDSAMYLTARIHDFRADDTLLPLSFSNISLNNALLDGADIALMLKDTVTTTKPDTSASKPLVIDVGNIELRNVTYRMSMLPVIDSLGARIDLAKLDRGHIDTGTRQISVNSLSVDSVSATYLTPSLAWLKKHPQKTDSITPDTTTSAPWTIQARRLTLTARDALYATRGVTPSPGFDVSYIAVKDVAIEVDSFYNRATSIRVPLRHLAARERCGIALRASGIFSMDSSMMRAERFNIATNHSDLYLDAAMGMGNLMSNSSLPLQLKADGTISLLDARMFMPSLSSYIASLPASAGLEINSDIHGTPSRLNVDRLRLRLPGYITFNANGTVDNPMNFNAMRGKVDFSGELADVERLKNAFLSGPTAKQVRIPASSIKGSIVYAPGNIDGYIKVRTSGGELALDGKWNQKAEGYNASLNTNSFPVNAFMPSLGIGSVTADLKIDGRGYNPASRATRMRADIDLKSMQYQGNTIGNIRMNAALDTCRLTADIVSDNSFANLDANIAATFHNKGYQWDLSTDVRALDLEAVHLSKTPMNGHVILYSSGAYYPRSGNIDAEVEIDDLDWHMDTIDIALDRLTASLLSTDTLTQASVRTGDLSADLTALESLSSVMKRLTDAQKTVSYQINKREVNIDSLQRALPHMTLAVDLGSDNPAANFLRQSDIAFSHASLDFANDSLISLQALVEDFRSGSTKLDNISFDAVQHGRFLVYTASVDNRPGTMDDFAHMSLRGFLADDRLTALFRQANINNEQGFYLGFNASVADSTVTVRLVPYTPTIAYKKWTVNEDNVIAYNFVTRHLDANLKVFSDSSYLHIYTQDAINPDSISQSATQEDVIVRLANIRLQDWLSISPFAPPVKGDVDADMRFRWDERELTGHGTVDLTDLYYGRERVGTFNLGVNVANDPRSKALRADVDLLVDGQKVITASGSLNDSTAVHPFLLDFNMIHFPLRVINPFLPNGVVQLSGMLNGRMDITGTMSEPIFNGFLDFDSTAVKVGMTGASYRFSEDKIPVDSNVVRFNDFSINGLNDHPLSVNGIVDARHISDINYDLTLKASDMMIVNSNRARGGAQVYGKAYVDIDATAKGNLRFLNVDANLDLLPGTNVTYVMTDAAQTLTPQSDNDMVKFVNFADTARVEAADSLTNSSMAMLLNAALTVSEGSTINVDLSPDGKNKASIQGSGTLDYYLSPMNGNGRVTGRFTINDGFVRYTPSINTGGVSMSIMSEKNFSFQRGSYIAFNGDMLNPTLNIHATDRLKANVTQTGSNSRLVNFDITVSITNTLENLNVAFDLSTDDDISIENELTAMSPEQRANQAMNMLLYNQYTGPGTKANANLSGNPLYSFLASQLNSWAASNIRGVDISFGIDQYNTTTDGTSSTTTSYSYRVSKTLFNDRFKIIVGGNYSTDADADENFSQNLINDISFEYMLNRSGTMYVRLFRHVGWESILEGEITQTGVGFVMKRKLNSLRDLFRFGPLKPDSQKKDTPLPASSDSQSLTPSAVKPDETDSIR